MAVRSGDDRQVCLRLLQRLALARRAIIGIYFPPIPWPMTQWSVPRISIESQSCDVRGSPVGGVHRQVQVVTPIVIFSVMLYVTILKSYIRSYICSDC